MAGLIREDTDPVSNEINFFQLEKNIIEIYSQIKFPFVILKDKASSKQLRSDRNIQSSILINIFCKNKLPYFTVDAVYDGTDKSHYENILTFFKWKMDNINTISLGRITKEEFYFGEFRKGLEDNFDYNVFKNFTLSEIKLINQYCLDKQISLSTEKDLLERLYDLNLSYNLLESDPTKHKMWGTLSLEMKNLASSYFNLRNTRKHKIK
jgi:hypothetical protein